MDFSSIRTDYKKHELIESELKNSPYEQFEFWFQQCLEAGCMEPNAMHLSTVNQDLQPSGRIVLLKGVDTGFCFYTNYLSKKGHDLAQNAKASLTFFWPELERQIRIEGLVEKVSREEANEYFQSRPRASQLGAQASIQSSKLPNRAAIDTAMETVTEKYEGQAVPIPDYWGGYRLLPQYFEFWQGRSSRLHDRLSYRKQADGSWAIERLSP